MLNASGGLENQYDYLPYGAERDYSVTISNQNYKFTGKERDSESQLDNYGARYYGSSLGRFMVPDWSARPTSVPYAVFGDPQSLNLYGYVRNDPVTRNDPTGHEGDFCGDNCLAFKSDDPEQLQTGCAQRWYRGEGFFRGPYVAGRMISLSVAGEAEAESAQEQKMQEKVQKDAQKTSSSGSTTTASQQQQYLNDLASCIQLVPYLIDRGPELQTEIFFTKSSLRMEQGTAGPICG